MRPMISLSRRIRPTAHRRKQLALLGVALLAALTTFTASSGASQMAPCPPITLVAHRGLVSASTTENTRAAFQAAWLRGSTEIEYDVRLTSDHKFVVMHDATLDRTTTGHGPVAETSLGQIERLRTKHGQPIPSLASTLAWAHTHHMRMLLELKYDPRRPWTGRDLRALVRLVHHHQVADQTMFYSFEARLVEAIERFSPADSTGWIALSRPTVTRAARTADVVFLTPDLISPSFVHQLQRHGVEVAGRRTNDPRQVYAMALDGVSLVITDRLTPATAATDFRDVPVCGGR